MDSSPQQATAIAHPFTQPGAKKDIARSSKSGIKSGIMENRPSDRTLHLAVSQATFNSVFTIELGQVLLKNQIIKSLNHDPT
jgi:phosphoglycolate phosphatase-like HAD superfamily hydrolase